MIDRVRGRRGGKTRAGETEEEKRQRKEAKYKQRAQDAAEGILDWDWSSDSDTSASDEDSEEEEEDDEEDEQLDEEELDLSDEGDEDEEDEDEEGKSEDESIQDDASTEAGGKGGRGAVCTCFRPGSPHDPAIIAAQLESFIPADVSSRHTRHSHLTASPSCHRPLTLFPALVVLSVCRRLRS